jgi:hypothetical protein
MLFYFAHVFTRKHDQETAVYQRYDKLLHGNVTGQRTKGKLDLLTIPFLKK